MRGLPGAGHLVEQRRVHAGRARVGAPKPDDERLDARRRERLRRPDDVALARLAAVGHEQDVLRDAGLGDRLQLVLRRAQRERDGRRDAETKRLRIEQRRDGVPRPHGRRRSAISPGWHCLFVEAVPPSSCVSVMHVPVPPASVTVCGSSGKSSSPNAIFVSAGGATTALMASSPGTTWSARARPSCWRGPPRGRVRHAVGVIEHDEHVGRRAAARRRARSRRRSVPMEPSPEAPSPPPRPPSTVASPPVPPSKELPLPPDPHATTDRPTRSPPPRIACAPPVRVEWTIFLPWRPSRSGG